MTNYDDLIAMLENFVKQSKIKPLTLGEALDTLDQAGYALIALIMVLPFLQPIPLGPLTVVGGLAFAMLGWQMWRGHDSPVLPEKIRNVVMSEKNWGILVKVCLKIVGFCRMFTRPRYTELVTGRRGQKIGSFILMSAGSLMAIPFIVPLPFNNMLPGFAILFFCLAELEDDGLMVFIAFGWLIVTVIYFALFFFGLYYLGDEALNYFKFGL
jgi:hypothetical protein